MSRKIIPIILVVFFSHFFINLSYAANQQSCDKRYLTLVNPIRSRELWFDKSLNPLKDQYSLINKNEFSGTWLIQYDVLNDQELVSEIKKFNPNQETGVFLEVSPEYAEKSRVIYPYDAPWFSPKAVFLSAYSPSERKRLIDRLFNDFKSEFGFYPKSVGAWWIDSYSLQYMKEKYQITSAMIVADQKTTDNYGIWGQWWGVAYYPSKNNVLVPASIPTNKLDLVIVQWAQRDLIKAYGEGYLYSNYSLQANDYIRLGENTDHFDRLVNTYLNCINRIGQITVGLETGIESVGYIDEYAKQLESLKSRQYLNSVTLSEFADKFKATYPNLIDRIYLGEGNEKWGFTVEQRSNDFLRDKIIYNSDVAFSDYFIADKSEFLDRRLPIGKEKTTYFPFWIIVLTLGSGLAFKQNRLVNWLYYLVFVFGSYGLLWRSYESLGWKVFYGPFLPALILYQTCLAILAVLIFIFINRVIKNIQFWKFLPLTLGLIFVLTSLRYTHISDYYYLGISPDDLKFLGLKFDFDTNIHLVNIDLPSYQAAALIHLSHNKIWENPLIGFVVFPLIQIVLAFVLYKLSHKLPNKLVKFIILILIVLTALYFIGIFSLDPRKVV